MSQGVKQTATDLRLHMKYKANKPTNLVPPRTLVNGTTTGLYTGNRMGTARPEANHQHVSLPVRAQICVRVV
jgi:hypothetical protein